MTNSLPSPQEAAQELLRRRKARQSLIEFTCYTKTDFLVGKHHEQIAAELEAVERGESDRLIILAPPRHTKSELASRRFPAWFIGRKPASQLIAATYAQDFALDFGRDVRGIVASEEYRALFPDVAVSPDSHAANRWHTNQGGISVYTGVGGPITGRGADLAIIDDPFKNREEADSEVRRETVWRWYTSTLRTRLMPGGAIVLILTRWHEDDLAGRLLDRQKGQWRVVELQAIADEGQPTERALWPEWYNLESLKRIRDEIGPRDWSALYQQRPQPDEGTYFKRSYFNWYEDKPEQLNVYICSDYAVTDGAGDFTEHGVFGVSPAGNIYVLDWWSGQATADVWIDALLDLVKLHKPLAVFGEAGQIRRSIEPFLTRRCQDRKIYARFEWVVRNRDKAAMARSIQARASMGKLFLPEGTEWAQPVLSQALSFPAGKHDDKVDVLALMGLVLDEAHPAIATRSEKRQNVDRWDKAFAETRKSSWKTV